MTPIDASRAAGDMITWGALALVGAGLLLAIARWMGDRLLRANDASNARVEDALAKLAADMHVFTERLAATDKALALEAQAREEHRRWLERLERELETVRASSHQRLNQIQAEMLRAAAGGKTT